MANKKGLTKQQKKYALIGLLIAAIIGIFFYFNSLEPGLPTIIGQGNVIEGMPQCARAGIVNQFIMCAYICPGTIDCSLPENYKFLQAVPLEDLGFSKESSLQAVYLSNKGATTHTITAPAGSAEGTEVYLQYGIEFENTGNVNLVNVQIKPSSTITTSCKPAPCTTLTQGGASAAAETRLDTAFNTIYFNGIPATPQNMIVGSAPIIFNTGTFNIDAMANELVNTATQTVTNARYKIQIIGTASAATGPGGSLVVQEQTADTWFDLKKSALFYNVGINDLP